MTIAVALFSDTARAEDPPSPVEPPPSRSPGVFESIINLFGNSSSSELEPMSAEDSASPPAVDDGRVEIQTDYELAVREAQLRNRPLLVVFGAEWCSWCRKLEEELAKPEAESLLSEWVIVKVDVDDEPEIASRLQASALPALRILDPLQKQIAGQEGYLELAELKTWLATNRKSADPVLQQVLLDTSPPDAAAIEQLLTLLAEPAPATRSAAMQRLAAHPSQSAAALVNTLKSGRLIQQLTAREILRRFDAPLGEIDPWRRETLRDENFAALVAWSEQRMAATNSEKSEEASTSERAIDSQALNQLLNRLGRADVQQRQSLIAQLVGLGPTVAVEVRVQLADADAVDDSSREALRELLYNVLASRELRLKQPGSLAALARLDAESHRQAAEVILQQAVSDDQPLVDELSRDADPLVRELSVNALGRLGVLTDGQRIEQLLEDSSPNVRTAVLRALTEHPSDKTVQSLCAYLRQETNEDLLVHGAKCLGQLSRQEETLSTLADLAGNASWRVRAAAIEATGQVLGGASGVSISFSFGTTSTNNSGKEPLPESLALAIVNAAFEEDEFVAERALKLLPKLLNQNAVDEKTLASIAALLGDHPDRLQELVSEVPANARSQSFAPLVRLAKEWLAEDGNEHTQRAAVLLSQLAPTELNDRLAAMIASENRSLRLAGLRAAIDSATVYRQESIEAARNAWATSTPRSPVITPWYEFSYDPALEPSKKLTPGVVIVPKVAAPPAALESPDDPADDIRMAADFFGAADAEKPPVTAEEPPPSSPDDIFAAVEGLFGGPPKSARVTSQSVPDIAKPKSSRPGAASALPSKWMEQWQRGSAADRPDWLVACDAPTQGLLASDDPQERAWAQALWLVLGHTDRADELLLTLNAFRSHDKQAAEEIETLELLSWLPSDKRLAELQRIAAAGDDTTQFAAALKESTLIDDPLLADWLFDYLKESAPADISQQAALVEAVLRSRVGFAADNLLTSVSPENYDYSGQPPYRVLKSADNVHIPGRVEACEWLRQRYLDSTDDNQRTIALAALAKLDHKTAVDAAWGAIQAADVESQLLDVALAIALFDAPEPSARRAGELLNHALPRIRLEALRVLTTPAVLLHQDEEALVPIVHVNSGALPGLWHTTEPFPIEVLRDLAATGEPSVQAQASLLLLASGEQVDFTAFEPQVEQDFSNYGKLCIAAALAKSGRADEAAVAHYQATYSSASDDTIPAELYQALRNLKGEEIVKLRRRMREEKGASLFNNT